MNKARIKAEKLGVAEQRKVFALQRIERGDHSEAAVAELQAAIKQVEGAKRLPIAQVCLVCLKTFKPPKQINLGVASAFDYTADPPNAKEFSRENSHTVYICGECAGDETRKQLVMER